MSSEQSRLRTTLLGSLLDVARRNRAAAPATLRLFEAGAVYLPTAAQRAPARALPRRRAADRRRSGRRPGATRRPRPADFFAAKGVLAGLLDALRVRWTVGPRPRAVPAPGPRGERSSSTDEPVGWLGEIHPLVAAEWDLSDTVAAFELDLDAVARCRLTAALPRDLTSFPEVREDLAVVVSEHVTAAEVLDVVRGAGAPLLAARRGVRRLPRRGAARRGQRVAGAAAHLSRHRPDADRRGGRGSSAQAIVDARSSASSEGRIRAA